MKLIEDIDFYYEDGFIVLTESFLLKRGKCCKSGCRHCPYDFNYQKDEDGESNNLQLH